MDVDQYTLVYGFSILRFILERISHEENNI